VSPCHVSFLKSRRRDSHPHRPHYGCGAFLCRATPASAGVQGVEPCLAVLEAACSPGAHSCQPTVCLAGIEPGTPRFTASYADHYTTDTVNQRKGWESNPQGLAARSRSRRGPSPGRVAHPSVVPGGIEPPISSVSGRRLRHWTTGPFRKDEGGRMKDELRSSFILHPSRSTPARSRTRTSSFEARRDVRFTTRASSGR
jgi:hypothetical protein